MLRCLGGAVVALAQQPVSGTKRQRGACKRGDLGRARLGVEDHELARQRDQADEDHGLDLEMLSRRSATRTMECLNSIAIKSVMIMPNTLWNTL